MAGGRRRASIHLIEAFEVAEELESLGLPHRIVAPDDGQTDGSGYIVRVEVSALSDIEAAIDLATRRSLGCRVSGPPTAIDLY